MGGEVVGARRLARHGVAAAEAGASVVVDVTVELLTQVLFLLAGIAAATMLAHHLAAARALAVLLPVLAIAVALLLAQRFGLLRLLDALTRRIAERWPALGVGGFAGLHGAALAIYARPGPLARATALHVLAWALGTVETWLVLHALGEPVAPLQALAIESLGMAARSAGFAVPGALGVQEGGFVLAAAALGLPIGPALSLSLVKRAREISTGLIGLGLWRCS